MTETLVASVAAVAFFLLLIQGLQGLRVGSRSSALPPRARAVLAAAVGTLAPLVVYAAVRVIDDVEALRPLAAFFDAHRRLGLLLTVPAAAVGFTLFMGGTLHLLLTSSRSEEFNLADLAGALRSGAWLRSRQWRRRVVVTAGVALLTFGLFGLFVVVAPVGVKLLVIAVFVYGAIAFTVRTVRA